MDITQGRVCRKCGEFKPASAFFVTRVGTWIGLTARCRTCFNLDSAAFRKSAAGRIVKKRYQQSKKGRATTRAYQKTSGAKQWRKNTMRGYRDKGWRKMWHYVERKINAGEIPREPCVSCGSTERLCAHHEDYAQPWELTWLCRRCHGLLHAYRFRGVENLLPSQVAAFAKGRDLSTTDSATPICPAASA